MSRLNTLEEAAVRLGVATRTLQRWIVDGVIGSHKVGRSRKVSDEDIEAFLKRGHRPSGIEQQAGELATA